MVSHDEVLSRTACDAMEEAFIQKGSILDEMEECGYSLTDGRFRVVLAAVDEELEFSLTPMTEEEAGAADAIVYLLEAPLDPAIDYSECSSILDSALSELERSGKPYMVLVTDVQRLLAGPVLSERQWWSVLDGLYGCLQAGAVPGARANDAPPGDQVLNSLCKIAAWHFRGVAGGVAGRIGFLYMGAGRKIVYGRDEWIAGLLMQMLGTIKGMEFSIHT